MSFLKCRTVFFCFVVSMVGGCINHRTDVIPPVTRAQKDFDGIRFLHEKGRSSQLVQKAQKFLDVYPEEELVRPVKYYLALNCERLGQKDVARKYFQEIIKLYPSSGWSELARSHLKTMDDR